MFIGGAILKRRGGNLLVEQVLYNKQNFIFKVMLMDKYNSDFWVQFSPILFLIFLGLLILWIKWPEEKVRMKQCREAREKRENNKDSAADLAIVTMPIWMDSETKSGLSSDSKESSSDSGSDSSSSLRDWDFFL